MSTRNKAATRPELIVPTLKRAGWDASNRDQVGIKIPVNDFSPQGITLGISGVSRHDP
ncbi:MAG: hypothetical protein HYR94_27500 [Chloroflexi bacterium]|nr:hypothetical protein [Chloroflexota bacterium]